MQRMHILMLGMHNKTSFIFQEYSVSLTKVVLQNKYRQQIRTASSNFLKIF